jgi:transposase InsO family protein
MTVQHQSYLELKKDTGEEFARKALLFNLESLKNNIRATARAMRCSPHTVYLAIEKEKKGNLKDLLHKPKSKHPHYIDSEREQMIIGYRKKTKLGKRRLRYYIFQKEGVNIPESTIGKVIKRAGLERKRRKRVKRDRASPSYNMESLFPFQQLQVDLKEILDKETLPKEVYSYLESSDLPLFQWTVIDVLTRIRFLSFSYRKDWFCGKAFLQLVIWWIRSFGFYYPLHIQSDGGVEFAASAPGSFKRNLERVFLPLAVTRSIIRKGHPEDNAFVERSHQTDDQEFYIPYLLTIKNEKDLIKRGLWWQNIYNLERPHQGIGNLTPYEKLKSLGYVTGEEICFFPCLILGSVCCLDPFKIKRKSVQDHLDHDLAFFAPALRKTPRPAAS